MKLTAPIRVVLLLLPLFPATTEAQSLLTNEPFKVPKYITENGERRLVAERIYGNEHPNNSLNRLSMISENQYRYPHPESGCGPIAMLNILTWYETYGLIEPIFRESDFAKKNLRMFKEIDRRLVQLSGIDRETLGGTDTKHIMITMDEIVRQQSDDRLRIHTDYYKAPIQLKDLIDTMPNFRSGFIVGHPIDKKTGELRRLHGMALIRADRAGYITLANMGRKQRGLLKTRDGKQIFIPQNPDLHEIQIVSFYRFIPFQPTARADR